MTCSSFGFFVVSMVLVLQFSSVPVPALSSTKYIDKLCHMPFVRDPTFCLRTLIAYHPAVSATNLMLLADTVIHLGMSKASKTGGFAVEAKKTDPTLKKTFESCSGEYVDIVNNLSSAILNLKKDPEDSNYLVMRCYDSTGYVKELIGKNTDEASKKLMEMTLQFEKLLVILVGATEAVGG